MAPLPGGSTAFATEPVPFLAVLQEEGRDVLRAAVRRVADGQGQGQGQGSVVVAAAVATRPPRGDDIDGGDEVAANYLGGSESSTRLVLFLILVSKRVAILAPNNSV